MSWACIDGDAGLILVNISETFHQKDGRRQIMVSDLNDDMHLAMSAQRLLNHVTHAPDSRSDHLRKTAIGIQRMAASWRLGDKTIIVHEIAKEGNQGLLTGDGSLEEIIRGFIEESLTDLQIVAVSGLVLPGQHTKVVITDWVAGHQPFMAGSGDALNRFDARERR